MSIKNVVVCDECGKYNDIINPPSKQLYEQAAIRSDLQILIPDYIVQYKHKDGMSDEHAAFVKGDFCSLECFLKTLSKIVPFEYTVRIKDKYQCLDSKK